MWELVAELHLKLGQPDEAMAAYRESLEVNSLGYLSPVDFELAALPQKLAASSYCPRNRGKPTVSQAKWDMTTERRPRWWVRAKSAKS